jgi:hypothetical protein
MTRAIMRTASLAVSSTLLGLLLLVGQGCASSESAPSNIEESEHEIFGDPRCGGIAGLRCPSGLTCEDDPNDSCDPRTGGADCSGICVAPPGSPPCAGFAGLQCPDGMRCIDRPNDGCDPYKGGYDCGGVCVGEATDAGPAPTAPTEPTEPTEPTDCRSTGCENGGTCMMCWGNYACLPKGAFC